jgi:hypothetical protein
MSCSVTAAYPPLAPKWRGVHPLFVWKSTLQRGSNELFRNDLKPFTDRGVERRPTIRCFKIDVTASSNELFRDDRIPVKGCFVQRLSAYLWTHACPGG